MVLSQLFFTQTHIFRTIKLQENQNSNKYTFEDTNATTVLTSK